MVQSESKLKAVVGLGNPGAKYDGTRHNIGFAVLDHLSRKLSAPIPQAKFEGQITTVWLEDLKLLLVWPFTYMNLSGRCVQAVTQFYKIDVEQDLIVVCDDLSLPLGKLRIRAKGSAGGQKGLNDILKVAGSQTVTRLRIGIDPPPPRWDAADYVLGKFREDEAEVVDEAIQTAASAILDWCAHGTNHCMNQYN